MSDDLTVQWYADDETARVFDGNSGIATLAAGERSAITERLRALGLNPKRWRKFPWGYESKLVRV